MRVLRMGAMYGSASLVQLRTSAALSLADSSLTWDSALCSSSLRSWRRWRLSAGSAYAGFRGARRPTRRIASRRTSLDSSLRVRNRAGSASAWPRWLSATPEGRQKDANTARRTPASRSETAEASNRETMNASVAADQDAPKPGRRAALFGPAPPPAVSATAALELEASSGGGGAGFQTRRRARPRGGVALLPLAAPHLEQAAARQRRLAPRRRVVVSEVLHDVPADETQERRRLERERAEGAKRQADPSPPRPPRVRVQRSTPEDPEPAEDPEPWREKCVDLLLEKPDSPETPPRTDPYASAP